jgi:hypothetical protein
LARVNPSTSFPYLFFSNTKTKSPTTNIYANHDINMNKVNRTLLLLLTAAIITTSAYTGTQTLNYLEQPTTCTNCHNLTPDNLTQTHREKNIHCIHCHSPPGAEGYLAARKTTATLLLTEKLTLYLNNLFHTNTTLNDSLTAEDLNVFQANCTKCHLKEHLNRNASGCPTCHRFHTTPNITRTWEYLPEGSHKKLQCTHCHNTNASIPRCTNCHTPHREEWNNTLCLNCHNDPHLPQKNGTYTTPVPKKLCATCHKTTYQILTAYNSKHNQKLTCTTCHTKHREKPTCLNCHSSHVHITSKICSTCHGYVPACTTCHADPHAPLSGLPRITDAEQLKNYAIKKGKTE